MPPLHSSTVRKRGRKCYVSSALSGVPKPKGTKEELVALRLPSHGPKRGCKCYVTPAFLGASSLRPRGPKTGCTCYVNLAVSVVPKPKRTQQELVDSPLGAGERPEMLCPPLHFRGSPNRRGLYKNGLTHPCLLGGPKEAAYKNYLPHPCLLTAPKEGANATSSVHSRGSPNRRGINKTWLPHPYLLRGAEEGGNAMSPVHSLGSPNRRGQNQNWFPHPCLDWGPKIGWKC